jgi:PIN domain nuclease of toxin-antitoxin system
MIEIGLAQAAGQLYVSPITAWELAVASTKPPTRGRPNFGAMTPSTWFRDAVRATASKVLPIRQLIALEAATVTLVTGHKDPGDCLLIATARVRRIPLVTHDAAIRRIASKHEGYLSLTVC